MYKKLNFRRQFILTTAPIIPFEEWQCLQIEKYYIYAHPDLEVNHVVDEKKSIVLIGNIYDSEEPEKGNIDILDDIMANSYSVDTFVMKIKKYAGRYALVYKDAKNACILPDALALREIYYCTKHNQVVCGSQPNLVAKYSTPKVKSTNDTYLLDFYRKHMKDTKWNPSFKWIGDETYYACVKHLLPNHYLDINRREARRFWPNETIKRLDLEEAVSKSCDFLKGNLKAMANRHSIMMAVTAGTDTRTLLAASKEIKDRIYYFVNNEGIGNSHPDISVPRQIFMSIGIPFHVHEVPNTVDEDFRRIFLRNTFFASERILPTIYNVYYKKLGDRVNIIGIGEIGRTRFGKEPKNLKSFRLAYKLGYKEGYYVMQQCEKILAEMLPVYRKFEINVLTGFYWEHMLGNWGVTGNSESDIAIEEVNPMNSHMLYEVFLGVDDKYTNYKKNVLFKNMIKRMWSELLEWPINPPYKRLDKVAWFMNELGLHGTFKELKYQVSYFKYLFKKWLSGDYRL